jgi:hypothetical protein
MGWGEDKRKILLVNDHIAVWNTLNVDLPTKYPNENAKKALNFLQIFPFDKNQSFYYALHGPP